MPEPTHIFQPEKSQQVSDHFFRTHLEGLFYFQVPKFNDQRGYFSQLAVLPELEQVLGKKFEIKQVNLAHSKQNVVRGLHAEGWNKLITVIHGLAFSAVADIRPDSKTYKQVETFKLGPMQNQNWTNGLYISQGLANSVVVLQAPVDYLYLVDRLYSQRRPEDETAISLFDQELAIDWPIPKQKMIISERDKQGVGLKEVERITAN